MLLARNLLCPHSKKSHNFGFPVSPFFLSCLTGTGGIVGTSGKLRPLGDDEFKGKEGRTLASLKLFRSSHAA